MTTTAEAPQTSGPPNERPGYFETLGQFLKDTWAELHRVQWPTQETVIKHTIIVVSLVIFMAIYIGALDYLISLIFHNVFHIRGEHSGLSL